MQDYQTLIAEHDEMDALTVILMEIAAGAPDVAEALSIRSHLSMLLDEHLSREDAFLYDRLLGASDDVFPAAARAFRSSFADLAADWSDYLRTWDAECMTADWPSFSRESASILARLRDRIAEENNLLYPLALQRGRIRLRAVA